MNLLSDPSGKTIALPLKNGFRIVRLEGVIRCQAAGNYTKIFLAGEQEIIICKRLKEVEEMLPAEVFFRVHQSHLVNLDFVEMWVRKEKHILKLKGGAEVPVARMRRNAMKEKLNI